LLPILVPVRVDRIASGFDGRKTNQAAFTARDVFLPRLQLRPSRHPRPLPGVRNILAKATHEEPSQTIFNALTLLSVVLGIGGGHALVQELLQLVCARSPPGLDREWKTHKPSLHFGPVQFSRR